MWVHVQSLQSFMTLCDPMDCVAHSPGSSVHGILPVRILEWVSCPPLGDLPNPGIEPASPESPALEGWFFITNAIWEALTFYISCCISDTGLNISHILTSSTE